MQKQLNMKVNIVSLRPFAPSVLKENVNEWFEFTDDSPYMMKVAKVKMRKEIKLDQSDENLFGIDKLNVKDLKCLQLLMLIILLEFKLFT